jgi:malonyl-CoA/methylmalonyl-CoA synthetase
LAIQAVDGSRWTYAELDVGSRRMARQLMGHGVTKGDRVLFQVHKSPMVVVLHLALLRCGAIQVPVNPDYSQSEVSGFLADSAPTVVICDPEMPHIEGPWSTLTLDSAGAGTLLGLPANDDALPTISPSDGAAILFTSGTTGQPKGAYLTHENLVCNAVTLIVAWGFTADDHLLHVLPLFHTHGLFVALHCVLGSGASLSLLPRFDVDALFHALRAEPPPTVLMGVPTHYSRLLDDAKLTAATVDHLRLFVSGSAPMPPTLHEAFTARTAHRVLERYGMTETSMLTSNPLHGTRKAGSVGQPLPGVDLRIRREPYVSDDVGAVEVRGPTVFGGYWQRPDLQAEVFTADGWFRTGDLGRLDADGYLYLVGRSKDLIISGGLNVYPADVETVLDALPGVRESAVVGVPDDDLGERVVAALTVEATSDLDGQQLRELARRGLAGYQTPKAVVVVDELPRNAMGKVEKQVLRRTLGKSP